jgi:hypothetical protein
MDRWRMVTTQDGTEHVASVVLGETEAAEHLDAEHFLAAASGWQVERGIGRMVCRKGSTVRTIEARRYTATNDTRSE